MHRTAVYDRTLNIKTRQKQVLLHTFTTVNKFIKLIAASANTDYKTGSLELAISYKDKALKL